MRKSALGFSIAAVVFLLEQVTKWIVLGPLDLRNTLLIKILPFFDLRYTENHGISLGLFPATSDTMRWVLVALTSLIAIGVGWWITREDKKGDQIALGMVFGALALLLAAYPELAPRIGRIVWMGGSLGFVGAKSTTTRSPPSAPTRRCGKRSTRLGSNRARWC